MIDLYYWPTSNGRKITIMLQEVALPYNIIPVNFKTGEQYAPRPENKIPRSSTARPAAAGSRSRFLSGRDLDVPRGEKRN